MPRPKRNARRHATMGRMVSYRPSTCVPPSPIVQRTGVRAWWRLGVAISVVCAGWVGSWGESWAEESTAVLEVAQSWHVDHPTHHVQGLCATEDTFWISSVERAAKSGYVFRVDRQDVRVVAERRLTIGDCYHPGGMQLVGDVIWVPLAEYRPRSTTKLLKLDSETLETLAELPIDDHIGALAADGEGNLYAANWDSRQIYRLDTNGQIHETIDSPTGVAYQDMELHGGLLYGTGRARIDGRTVSVVDVLDPGKWQLVARYELRGERRTGGGDFGREGLSKLGDSFYLMPEDGPHTTVYRFDLPREAEKGH